ncbi:MAG: hypothetical protein AAB958_02395 [Patescibacteria group bacterium]
MNDLTMDNFVDLFKYQNKFANKVSVYFNNKVLSDLTVLEKVSETKDYILNIHGELKEVLDKISWKRHRREKEREINREDLIEEMIDNQKYLWALMAIWDVTPEEFIKKFREKSVVVERRWSQEMEGALDGLRTNKKIAIVDIDGVLNNYPLDFYRWISINRNISTSEALKITKEANPIEWHRLKHEYRLSGVKKFNIVRTGANDLLNYLHSDGYYVVITTNRPVSIYNNLMFDTLYWLENNDLYFDYIYWADFNDKILFFKDILCNIKLFIDDSLDICNQFKCYGVKTIIVPSRLDSLNKVIEECKRDLVTSGN